MRLFHGIDRKKRVAGLLLLGATLSVLAVYSLLHRPEAAPNETGAAGAPEVQCVQGVCAELEPDVAASAAPSSGASLLDDNPTVFIDVTAGSGVDFIVGEYSGEALPFGGGAVIFDFNNDGHQDIYAVNAAGSNALYRNNGDGTFAEIAVAAGVDDSTGRGQGACAADYDNDGRQDLYVTNFGFNKLFRNNGGGKFADVTAAARAHNSTVPHRWMGCAWGDYDRDGFLDLIVVRHLPEYDAKQFSTQEPFEKTGGLALYHNNGDGTFADVTGLLGDTSAPATSELEPVEYFGNVWGAGFQPGWLDLDNDGDVDLYVVNDFGGKIQPNVLWRNDGPAADGSWSFVDVSSGSGADIRINGMGLAVADYNLDGFFDLYMTNIGDNVLLRNDGEGLSFTNTAVDAEVTVGMTGPLEHRATWGAVFFDYDNDGDEDLYVVSGHLLDAGPSNLAVVQPNVLLRNERDGTFIDVSAGSGADDPGLGRGGVYLDFDGDGCLDLFITNYGQGAKLLRNVCVQDNAWLAVKPVGTASNRDSIGARITVVAGGGAQIREILGGSSQMGQNMMVAHFGLGAATAADSVTVRWPSGKVLTLTNVAVNQHLTVTEPR